MHDKEKSMGYSVSRTITAGSVICTDELNQHMDMYCLARDVAENDHLKSGDLLVKAVDLCKFRSDATDVDPSDSLMNRTAYRIVEEIHDLPMPIVDYPIKKFSNMITTQHEVMFYVLVV